MVRIDEAGIVAGPVVDHRSAGRRFGRIEQAHRIAKMEYGQSGDFDRRMPAGDHFFLGTERVSVLRSVRKALAQLGAPETL
jgi:surfactin synthase thioesterase subunit